MSKKNERLYKLKRKDPTIAVVLSLLITGLGHFYLGKWLKGFLFMFTQIVLWLFLLGWVIWIICPIVAYYDAKNMNEILALELGVKVW